MEEFRGTPKGKYILKLNENESLTLKSYCEASERFELKSGNKKFRQESEEKESGMEEVSAWERMSLKVEDVVNLIEVVVVKSMMSALVVATMLVMNSDEGKRDERECEREITLRVSSLMILGYHSWLLSIPIISRVNTRNMIWLLACLSSGSPMLILEMVENSEGKNCWYGEKVMRLEMFSLFFCIGTVGLISMIYKAMSEVGRSLRKSEVAKCVKRAKVIERVNEVMNEAETTIVEMNDTAPVKFIAKTLTVYLGVSFLILNYRSLWSERFMNDCGTKLSKYQFIRSLELSSKMFNEMDEKNGLTKDPSMENKLRILIPRLMDWRVKDEDIRRIKDGFKGLFCITYDYYQGNEDKRVTTKRVMELTKRYNYLDEERKEELAILTKFLGE
jgi:hypothetical protein